MTVKKNRKKSESLKTKTIKTKKVNSKKLVKYLKKEQLEINEKKINVIAFVATIVIIVLLMTFSNLEKLNYIPQIQTQKLIEWGNEGEFQRAYGIWVSGVNKNLYVANIDGNNINRYSITNDKTNTVSFIKTWGEQGEGKGQFNEPSGLTFDKDGNVYVADAVNGRIQKFDSNGKYLMEINLSKTGFWRPRNVLVAPNGDIYVANTGKWNIYRFNKNGGQIGAFTELFGEVFGLAMDKAGLLYVADAGARAVVVLSPDLQILRKHKIKAWRNVQGTMPMIAMDSKQRLYCVSAYEQKIAVYDTTDPKFKLIGEIRNQKGAPPLFNNPLGIAIDGEDNIYVTERVVNKVMVLKTQLSGSAAR